MSAMTTPADMDRRDDAAMPGYMVEMDCRNCGWRGSVEYNVGRSLDRMLGEYCPNCEVRDLYRRARERWEAHA